MLEKTPVTPAFHVVGGAAVAAILGETLKDSVDLVARAYLDHENGLTNNPDSYFLRFPKEPANRIIALPATIEGDRAVSGIKWISSWPGNVSKGMQRASAVLVLNDPETGYAYAVLEASRISAVRTAASAVLAAWWLNGRSRKAGRIAFVGAGIIARTILDVFAADGWTFGALSIHDLDADSAGAFSGRARQRHALMVEAADLDAALSADIVVLATTAARPYIRDHGFRPGQIVLNISLRDIAPEIIAASNNILDDVEHCLKADTSPDLAVRQYGHRDFITGTLAQLMQGRVTLDPARATIFSPFGLGVLDLALGARVFDAACRRGSAVAIDDFLFEMGR